jgi:hypothetical protein
MEILAISGVLAAILLAGAVVTVARAQRAAAMVRCRVSSGHDAQALSD